MYNFLFMYYKKNYFIIYQKPKYPIQSKPLLIGSDWIGFNCKINPIQTEPQIKIMFGSDDILVKTDPNRTANTPR